MYKIECIECLKRGVLGVYHGELGFSPYYRGHFHLEGLRKATRDSVLLAHNWKSHPGMKLTMMNFRMSVVDQYSCPILCQSQEGLAISQSIRERGEGEE